MHKTSAWPLAWVYVGLVMYASLYPFFDWRNQGIAPWDFLGAPWPRYWTGFDLTSNALGYAPFGFLVCLSALRTGKAPYAVTRATLMAAVLSLMMEAIQSYLPARVPSYVDLILNIAGAWAGAVMALALERLGAIDRWSRFRSRWFLPDSRGVLVLLALWPLALLFPPPVPLGLGQILERLEEALADLLAETPFLDWLPVRDIELQPLLPVAELTCVMLGGLIPCLLGFCIIRAIPRRIIFVVVALLSGISASALSAALSYGPQHAWSWLSLPAHLGLGMAATLALMLCAAPSRVCGALVLLALGIYLSVINQAPTSTYFEQTLQTWEQGRFIRFHGLAQWLGWIWPYAAMIHLITRIWTHEIKN